MRHKAMKFHIMGIGTSREQCSGSEERIKVGRRRVVAMRVVRVLMVEDDHMQRSVLELLFEQANTHNDGFVNFEVKTVDSGLDALAEVRETAQANRQYDLILIDYVLGDMTGDTLIPHFRDLLGDSVAIVLTSIHSDARDRSLEMSADAFLHKP